MNPSEVTRLVSKLRYNLKPRRKLRNPEGPQGRHDKIRKIVTALIKHERIEVFYNRGDESRGYAERLISDAIRYGEKHQPTMEMASYWLLEKQLVHKLFKVLVPRFQNWTLSYTKMWKTPSHKSHIEKCVLELRNNVYPPLGPDTSNHKNLIHNVLLSAAKKAYDEEKALKLKQKLMTDAPKEETGHDGMPENVNSEAVQMSSEEPQQNDSVSSDKVLMNKAEVSSSDEADASPSNEVKTTGDDDLSLNELNIEDKKEEKESSSTTDKEK